MRIRIRELFLLPILNRQRLHRNSGEALSEGEALGEGEGEELKEQHSDESSDDEEVVMPVKKEPVLTPWKSSRVSF
jgi:hypothetical protein